VTVVEGDLAELPVRLFPREPYVVLHFASKQIDRDGRGFEDVNVRGTDNLLRALTPACRGVVYGSSVSVYGQGPQEGNDEDATLCPSTALARSRVDAERALFDAGRALGFEVFALRPRFILGRGDRSTLPGLARLFARGISLGSGAQRFTIVDVDDYAAIALRLATAIATGATPPAREALHVGYRRSVSLDEIRDAVGRAMPLPRVRVRVPVTRALTRAMARAPSRSIRAAATKLELVGFSHHVDVRRLGRRVGSDVVDKDPALALRAAVAHLSRSS
jgi:nucleoside-diphosphate-sugar epimerase